MISFEVYFGSRHIFINTFYVIPFGTYSLPVNREYFHEYFQCDEAEQVYPELGKTLFTCRFVLPPGG